MEWMVRPFATGGLQTKYSLTLCHRYFYKEKNLRVFNRAIFFLIFPACSYVFALDPASTPVKPISGGRKIACPSRDFSEFMTVFSENTETQMAFTKYPLKQQRLDANAEPEPKPVTRKLRRNQVSFPVMPNETERTKLSLVFRIDEKKPTHVKLTLAKRDTDYQIYYFFILNSCWRLVRIEDWSL